jgi:hypothetical protein
VSAQWRPGCSNAQTAEDTPHRLLRAARSESCHGLASRIDARAPDRPPEALTGQLKRSITAMSITIYGWTTRSIVDRLTPSSRAIEAMLLPGAAAQVAAGLLRAALGNPPGGARPARTVVGESNG